jgi:quercetin dioxygenase-like cupin family protein
MSFRHYSTEENGRSFHRYRMFFDQPGAACDIHSHDYDHLFVVIAGRCRVETQAPGGELVATEHDAENPDIEVRAGDWHRITGLEPGTRALCVFSRWSATGELHDPKEGGRIDPHTVVAEVFR